VVLREGLNPCLHRICPTGITYRDHLRPPCPPAGSAKRSAGRRYGVRREAQAKLDALVDNVAANLRGKLAAYAAALEWVESHDLPPVITSIECNKLCTCAAKSGVIGHAAFCPLGEKAESDACAMVPLDPK
jgi:hypothetical protein